MFASFVWNASGDGVLHGNRRSEHISICAWPVSTIIGPTSNCRNNFYGWVFWGDGNKKLVVGQKMVSRL